MCDLRVVEENSKLGFLNRRFGVPLIDGATVRLPALVGVSRALDLILTGRLLEPKEALDWGLANRVVTSGTAFGQAMNLAKEIVKFPQVETVIMNNKHYFTLQSNVRIACGQTDSLRCMLATVPAVWRTPSPTRRSSPPRFSPPRLLLEPKSLRQVLASMASSMSIKSQRRKSGRKSWRK